MQGIPRLGPPPYIISGHGSRTSKGRRAADSIGGEIAAAMKGKHADVVELRKAGR